MTTFEPVFLTNNPPADARVNRLIYWGKRLHELGLVSGTDGNLSFRTENGFVITGSGITLKTMRKEDMAEVTGVEVRENQILVCVTGNSTPSKESLLHWEVYRFRRETNAVFHTHDQLMLERATELKLPITSREQPKGSYELAKEASTLLNLIKDTKYFVLREHGVVSLGEDLEEAGQLAETMHKMVKNRVSKGGI